MTGNEFIRKIRRLGRERSVEVREVPHRGKGDHLTLYYGDRHTIVGGRGELKKGMLHTMLRQLGVALKDLQ